MIVIEDIDTDDGHGFHVYLDGDKERLKGGTKEEDLSAAEYWGSVLFEISQSVLLEAGVIEGMSINPKDMN